MAFSTSLQSRFYTILILLTAIVLTVCQEDAGFRSVGLRHHNSYRVQNNAQPLQLDQELNKLAHAHAEKLADWNNMTTAGVGFRENLWSYRGELLPLAKDLEYAIKNWYTGSKAPGRTNSIVDSDVLQSNSVQLVGFGVGTSEKTGEGYSVVVALYS